MSVAPSPAQPSVDASTDWQERVDPDEAQRHAEAAQRFVAVQRRRDSAQGSGRALHRKQTGAFRGELKVLGDLPVFARQGLFARAGRHETWMRLSNGGLDRADDRRPDIRGLALKVFDVSGASALGDAETLSQDFTLIHRPAFAFARSDEFVELVLAAAEGKAALLRHLLKRYGLLAGAGRLLALQRSVSAPFAGYANAPVYSAAPLACGPYAVRVRLLPDEANGPARADARLDWGVDLARRLARGPLRWALQLQPFVDEATTPIEDASVDWPTPYTTVASLTLPQQSVDAQFLVRASQVAFDPWNALAAHRPLGEVMRARKVVYFASQVEREAVPAVPLGLPSRKARG